MTADQIDALAVALLAHERAARKLALLVSDMFPPGSTVRYKARSGLRSGRVVNHVNGTDSLYVVPNGEGYSVKIGVRAILAAQS